MKLKIEAIFAYVNIRSLQMYSMIKTKSLFSTYRYLLKLYLCVIFLEAVKFICFKIIIDSFRNKIYEKVNSKLINYQLVSKFYILQIES